MAEQTAPGKVLYLVKLDVAGHEAGAKVSADDLPGLNVPALEAGGFLERDKEPRMPCELCQTQGKAEDKKKTYNLEQLQDHYRKAHGAFAPPEEV